MTLRWYYSVDASTVLEITDRVRLPIPEGDAEPVGVGAKADAGAGWEGDLLVDDQAGDLIMLQFRRIYCVQDAAPAGAQVIGNWFISNLRVRRMDPWATVARQWIVTMADENSLLSRRKFVGSDANRPSETDIVRLRWFLTTTEANVLSPDETYIDTTDPVTLDAADLRTQGPEELMTALTAASGKHHWIKYEEAAAVGGAIVSSSVANPTVITTTSAHGLTTGQTIVIAGHSGSTPSINGSHVVTVTGATTYTIPVNVTVGGTGGTSTTVGRYILWYANQNTSTLYSSTLSISNVAAQIDSSLVYALSDDAELDRAGGRMASGGIGAYDNGWVYVQDTVVGDRYAYVDRVMPARNVKTAGAATAQATRQLAELKLPDDEITTVWTVEAANLNKIMHGMRVPVHVTHFPNYTDDSDATDPGYLLPGYAADYVWCRVMERTVNQIGPTTFGVALRLSPQIIPVEIEPNAYMCGPYSAYTGSAAVQVFWAQAEGECNLPALAGSVHMLGSITLWEGWGFDATITDLTFHAAVRSVPGACGGGTSRSFWAELNGVPITGAIITHSVNPIDNVWRFDATVPVVVNGDEIKFKWSSQDGCLRQAGNNAGLDATYITGGLL